jgi:hypothetical protein
MESYEAKMKKEDAEKREKQPPLQSNQSNQSRLVKAGKGSRKKPALYAEPTKPAVIEEIK